MQIKKKFTSLKKFYYYYYYYYYYFRLMVLPTVINIVIGYLRDIIKLRRIRHLVKKSKISW